MQSYPDELPSQGASCVTATLKEVHELVVCPFLCLGRVQAINWQLAATEKQQLPQTALGEYPHHPANQHSAVMTKLEEPCHSGTTACLVLLRSRPDSGVREGIASWQELILVRGFPCRRMTPPHQSADL